MPAYALLGATGATGSAILRCLISQPLKDLTLKIFVRSKPKLLKAFPDLEQTSALKVIIIEGTPSDPTAFRECLKGVDVVMGCIGTNSSSAGISLIFDTATAIIDALKYHQTTQGSAYKAPTIIQLRSASLNPRFTATTPWIARKGAWFFFYHIYKDLEKASQLFASTAADAPELLQYIFIDPPAIHDPDGTTPTGYKLILEGVQDPILSYADLGAAFCEVASRKDEFAGQGVAVSATGAVKTTWGIELGYMATGLKSRIWG